MQRTGRTVRFAPVLLPLMPHPLGVFTNALAMTAFLALLLQLQIANGVLTGMITFGECIALPGATVLVQSEDSRAIESATSDASGRYTFHHLLPGSYLVQVNSVPYFSPTYRITVSNIARYAELDVVATEFIEYPAWTSTDIGHDFHPHPPQQQYLRIPLARSYSRVVTELPSSRSLLRH